MIAMYAALGGGGGAMASSSSRSLPAASSSALLSASFPGPGLWRRRRTLVGRDVVVGLACQLSVCVDTRRKCLDASYRCKLNYMLFELGSFCCSRAYTNRPPAAPKNFSSVLVPPIASQKLIR